MITSDRVGAAARELLEEAFEGGVRSSLVNRYWCSAMHRNGNGPETRKSSSVAAEPVCGKLRVMFDVAEQPMPDSLASLADLLDAALERGDLSASKRER